MSGWWCGSCGMSYEWRKPNRLPTLQVGVTVQDQIVCAAYAAPDGECNNLICALRLITNLMKRQQVGNCRENWKKGV